MGGHQDARGARSRAEEDGSVIVEGAAGNDGAEVGADFGDGFAGNVFGQLEGVRADIAHGADAARTGGVGAPGGLFLALALEESRKPALGVFDVDFSDRSKLTRSHASARFLDHGVAGIGMRQAKVNALLRSALNGGLDGSGLLQRHAEGLVEDDVKAGI